MDPAGGVEGRVAATPFATIGVPMVVGIVDSVGKGDGPEG